MADQQAPNIALGDAPAWVEPVKVDPLDVYTFDGTTGELIGTDKAQPDPMEAGRFLVPANATTVAPPVVLADEEAANVAGVWVKRKKLPKVPKQDNDKRTPDQVRRDQINVRLDKIDSQSVRALRDSIQAISKGKPVPPASLAKLDALELEAVGLRTELAALKV